MKKGQSLSELTARLLMGLENQFKTDRPDLILAHGDTTTCFATALSSFYHRIPFFHVEAGLRTHRLSSPFPEEFNRQITTPIACHHFAPTATERKNLTDCGVSPSAITVTGSTVHDAVQAIKPAASPIDNLAPPGPVVVITLHRREAAANLHHTLAGIRAAALNCQDTLFVCPVHPSPAVQDAFNSSLKGISNVMLTEPLEYPRFISLLMSATLVVTDSGGVQEEAAFLGKRVLLARSETERLDGMEQGLVRLIGTDARTVQQALEQELFLPAPHRTGSKENNQSSASDIIAEKVMEALQ